MVLLAHTFETGLASGTGVTAGNSGTGGDAFNSATVGAGAALTYDAGAARGALCLKAATTGTASQAFATWDASSIPAAASHGWVRATVTADAVPSQLSVVRLRGGGVQALRITVDSSTLKLQIRNSANTAVASSATAMTIGVPWRIVIEFTVGSSAPATLYIYRTLTSNTPDETINASAQNFGTANVDECNLGIVVGTANAGLRLDDVVFTTVAMPGPPSQSITLADGVTLADGTGTQYVGARATGDAVTLADSLARAVARARGTADGVGLADSLGRVVAAARIPAEALTVADALTRQYTAARAVSDALTAADSVARAATQTRTAGDAVTLADSLARAVARARGTGDVLGLGDVLTGRAGTATRDLTDSAGLADALDRAAGNSRDVTDTIGLGDDARSLAAGGRATLDTITLADTAAAGAAIRARQLADAVHLADQAYGRAAEIFRAMADGLTLVDAVRAFTARTAVTATGMRAVDWPIGAAATSTRPTYAATSQAQ